MQEDALLELTEGNLLEAEVDALVNSVNTHGAMGKGIALQFKKAFPENYRAYRSAFEHGELRPGEVFVFSTSRARGPKYIMNFPTKRHWRDRARLDDIATGLNDLVSKIDELHIQSIAVPPLGTGYGGLSWKTVYPMLEEALGGLENVRVLLYKPTGAPNPEDMVNRTSRPRMTEGRAAVILAMKQYLVKGWEYRLSLLELQKLAYFLQEAGQQLRLRFKPLVYGPYADELRHVLNRIEGHYVSGFGDARNAPTTALKLLPQAIDDALKLAEDKPDLHVRLKRVGQLVENFETPFGMELLSSVHWVWKHGFGRERATTIEEAFDQIRIWNTRKARIFKRDHLQLAWSQLANQGWLVNRSGSK